MKERPILFSGAMVRAYLAGRKGQTRRVVKGVDPEEFPYVWGSDEVERRWDVVFADYPGDQVITRINARCPYGVPGDRLWGREAWKPHSLYAHMKPSVMPQAKVFYRADDGYAPSNTPWVPGIHMPRWASRVLLEITGLRVERLKDISEADAIDEGVFPAAVYGGEVKSWLPTEDHRERFYDTAVEAYRALWEIINGPGSWDANPWVWAVTFPKAQAQPSQASEAR